MIIQLEDVYKYFQRLRGPFVYKINVMVSIAFIHFRFSIFAVKTYLIPMFIKGL